MVARLCQLPANYGGTPTLTQNTTPTRWRKTTSILPSNFLKNNIDFSYIFDFYPLCLFSKLKILQNVFKTKELFKSFSFSKWHGKNAIEYLIHLGFPNKFIRIFDIY